MEGRAVSNDREIRHVYTEGEAIDGPPVREFVKRGQRQGHLVSDLLAMEPGQWYLVSKGDEHDVKSRRSRADSARRNAMKAGAQHGLRVHRSTDHELWVECFEVDPS